jgi:cell division protein ZapE
LAEIGLEELRAIAFAAHEPLFMLPARFAKASFDSYDITNPSQAGALATIRTLLDTSAAPRRRWRREAATTAARGLYLVGPPGIGKTHLLAAAYRAAPAPRLFATFDEFLAASGALTMAGLTDRLVQNGIICIDEIDLDDPAGIMLLNSLLRRLLDAGAAIIATANARPSAMSGAHYFEAVFARELGEIASSFQIVELQGEDYRQRSAAGEAWANDLATPARVARLHWEELQSLLADTHPMRDAAWLLELDAIELDRLEQLPGNDRTMRFVRFIDRVYDRAVALSVRDTPPPGEVLAAFRNQPRFALHYVRCRSRLIELLGRNSRVDEAPRFLEQATE